MAYLTIGKVLDCAVVGCADIESADDTWVRRHGDTAIVKCNQTGETFYVTCLDTEWKGELSACSRGRSALVFASLHPAF